MALRGREILGKPGTVERCREQLRASSGQEVVFLTAVHVIDGTAGRTESHVDRTVVKFRELSDAEIDRYIERDQPLDCAGGFKAESLGIALFDRIESIDPTGLTGLPLSWLCGALRRAQVRSLSRAPLVGPPWDCPSSVCPLAAPVPVAARAVRRSGPRAPSGFNVLPRSS